MIELLGRDRELLEAMGVLDPDGSEAAVLIEGTAGIGKTRVLDAVVQLANARDVELLVTRPAEAESQVGLLAFRDLMDQLGLDAMRMLPDPQRERLEIVLGLRSLAPGQELDEGLLALSLFTILRARARGRPLLLAIDDVQWLDASSSALLEVALRRLVDEPVRVVATRRSTEPARLDLARIYRDRLRVSALLGGRVERLSPTARDVLAVVALATRPDNGTIAVVFAFPEPRSKAPPMRHSRQGSSPSGRGGTAWRILDQGAPPRTSRQRPTETYSE